MKISLNQIEKKIEMYEKTLNNQSFGEFNGKRYVELTDQEKEEYFDFLYGENRKFGFEAVEKLKLALYGEKGFKNWLNHKCKNREQEPTKKMNKKELKNYLKQRQNKLKVAIEQRRKERKKVNK